MNSVNAIRESLRNDYSRLIAIVTLIFVSYSAFSAFDARNAHHYFKNVPDGFD